MKSLGSLKCLRGKSDDINIGTQPLNECIEETIASHLSKQWPLAKEDVKNLLKDSEASFLKIRRVSPIDVLCGLRKEIESNFFKEREKLELKQIRILKKEFIFSILKILINLLLNWMNLMLYLLALKFKF